MSLGTKINHYRQQSVLTQEQLAEQMNVTRQTVSNWERGINEPDFAGLCRLAEVFGVTLNDFADDAPHSDAQPEDIKQGDSAEADSDEDADKGFTQSAAGILDGAALFLGVLVFFVGGLLIGGWKGWLGSFIAGGCLFLAISSVFHAIAAMRK